MGFFSTLFALLFLLESPCLSHTNTLVRNLEGEPVNIHPISYADHYGAIVVELLFSSLLQRNLDTNAWEPLLAEKWESSKDNRTFTFHLRKGALFHDGHSITAEDVKFSFDAIFIDDFINTPARRPYYESISKVEVLDPLTIRFTARDSYYMNFISLAELFIIPKHIYSDIQKAKKMFTTGVGSGPYKLVTFERGQKIVLKRFDQWLGSKNPQDRDPFHRDLYRIENIILKFISDDNVFLEMIKRGDIDYQAHIPTNLFVERMKDPPFGTKIIKHQPENSSPRPFGFIGWNLRNTLFQDKKVRLALAHLMNREEMNKKFRYNMSYLATGPNYIQSDFSSPKVKPILFDSKKAIDLLREAGWEDRDKKGVLSKVIGGQKKEFRFELIYANKIIEKYFTWYREDLKKVGIDMNLKFMEWNSFIKLLDEGKFEAASLAWSGGLEWDPKQVWHSSAAVPGGNNFIAYKVPEVDKLIDAARIEPNREKRVALLRKIYEKIAEDAPYVWLFNDKYDLFVTSSKIHMPKESFKFDLGFPYWQMEP